MSRPCAICSEWFTGRAKTQTTCSPKCRTEAARRRAADWYEKHGGDPGFRARAKAASRSSYLKRTPESLERQREATRRWRAANKDKTAAQYREWRQANADRVRAKVQRRRARLLGAWVEDVDLGELWVRGEGLCGICGEYVDPDVLWPDPLSKTLDHIVPLSKGGTHEWSNAQLAHATCNLRKGARTA